MFSSSLVAEGEACPMGGEGVTLRFARKAGIEPTLTVLETAFLPLEDFRKMLGARYPKRFIANNEY